MTRRWLITALGKDRPGIVAGVTKVLYQLSCNLEDSAMTRLEGEFTIMLIFSGPAKVTEEILRRAFAGLSTTLKLAVHLKALSALETGSPRSRGRTYTISVYGADRTGIVFRVADALSRDGINITDVHTHRSAVPRRRSGRRPERSRTDAGGPAHRSLGVGRGPSLYLLLLEVEIPAARSVSSVEGRLKRIAKELGVEVSLRPAETNVL